MKLDSAVENLQEILEIATNAGKNPEQMKLAIPVYDPGINGAVPCVKVVAVHADFEQNSSKVLLQPDHELTTLSAADKENIATSVRLGNSWHAYREMKEMSRVVTEMHSAMQTAIELIRTGQNHEALAVLTGQVETQRTPLHTVDEAALAIETHLEEIQQRRQAGAR